MESNGNNLVTLNIGGTVFKCYSKTLSTFPNSKLARLDKQDETFNENDNQYFFDRNPILFACILDSYRKDGVHLPRDTCGTTFRKELDFWEISPQHVAPCCWEALYRSNDAIATVNLLTESFEKNSNTHLMLDGKHDFRTKLWLFLDEPRSSRLALAWGLFISFVIFAAILVDAMVSLSICQENYTSTQMEILWELGETLQLQNSTIYRLGTKMPMAFILYINVICHAVLTIELIVSFTVCHTKRDFLSNSTRILAGFGYLSYWIGATIFLNINHIRSVYVLMLQVFFQYMSICKIARLFYITRSIPSFRIICLTFSSSKKEMKMLIFLLCILVCLFGYFMYAAEFHNDTNITNVFIAIYWALITLTTVGYGNYVPDTAAGHVIAGACAVCGVLVLAMPVGIIVSKFYKYYSFYEYKKEHAMINEQVASCKNEGEGQETDSFLHKGNDSSNTTRI